MRHGSRFEMELPSTLLHSRFDTTPGDMIDPEIAVQTHITNNLKNSDLTDGVPFIEGDETDGQAARSRYMISIREHGAPSDALPYVGETFIGDLTAENPHSDHLMRQREATAARFSTTEKNMGDDVEMQPQDHPLSDIERRDFNARLRSAQARVQWDFTQGRVSTPGGAVGPTASRHASVRAQRSIRDAAYEPNPRAANTGQTSILRTAQGPQHSGGIVPNVFTHRSRDARATSIRMHVPVAGDRAEAVNMQEYWDTMTAPVRGENFIQQGGAMVQGDVSLRDHANSHMPVRARAQGRGYAPAAVAQEQALPESRSSWLRSLAARIVGRAPVAQTNHRRGREKAAFVSTRGATHSARNPDGLREHTAPEEVTGFGPRARAMRARLRGAADMPIATDSRITFDPSARARTQAPTTIARARVSAVEGMTQETKSGARRGIVTPSAGRLAAHADTRLDDSHASGGRLSRTDAVGRPRAATMEMDEEMVAR